MTSEKETVYSIDKLRPGNRNGRLAGNGELPRKITQKWVVATWTAEVRSTARRLEADLHRTDYERLSPGQQADYVAVCHAIDTAKRCAEWSAPRTEGQPRAALRQLGRRAAVWWTGSQIDVAYCALQTASQILLSVEPEDAVRAHIPDMAAAFTISFHPDNLRLPGYLRPLEILAQPCLPITYGDQAELRPI